MGIRFERKAALIKAEETYGVDPTPSGAANAVLLRNLDIDTAQGERIPRDVIRAGMGQVAQFLVGRHVTMQASVDLAGSGTAGTAPAYGPLLKAFGLAEVVTEETKVEYTPVDAGFGSVATYYNLEGNRSIALGGRGTGKIMMPRNRLPMIQGSLTALWSSDAAVAFPSQTLTPWKDPVPVTKANTPTFTLDGYAAPCSNFELDFGMSVAYRELINLKEINVQDRLPNFSCQIETPPFGTKNFFALMGGASVALALTHGTVAGNIVEISSSKLQILDVKPAEDQKVAMLNITGNFVLGGTDFTISVK